MLFLRCFINLSTFNPPSDMFSRSALIDSYSRVRIPAIYNSCKSGVKVIGLKDGLGRRNAPHRFDGLLDDLTSHPTYTKRYNMVHGLK